MKILLISNFYYNRGGDCTYLLSLKELLEKKGHETLIFSMHHPQNFESEYDDYFVSYINYDEEVKNQSLASGLRVLNRTIYSREAKSKIEKLIANEKPDIAHLQNIHHHITPSIFHVLRKYNIPIVWTLHDFTLACPNTSFLSHGEICEKCRKHKYYWSVLSKCKKNSYSASFIASIETVLLRALKFYDLVDYFIAPSIFLKNKLIEYGFKEDKIKRLNNFIFMKEPRQIELMKSNYYLYVGRISEEKGVRTLIDAAVNASSSDNGSSVSKGKVKLKIVGGGPLEKEMIDYARSIDSNGIIEFLGYKSHEEVMELLGKALFIVLPSECYENFPYAAIEACSLGKPVIGSRLGGIPEIVKNWDTGLLFDHGDSDELSVKISFLLNHRDKAAEMGKKARRFVEEEIGHEKHYKRIMNIYNQAISKHNNN